MTAPARSTFRFVHRLRVRWAEVDMQKIVFNAHYLMYLDTAMAAYWRTLALPYEDAMKALGGDIYLRHVEVDFQASARLDDMLDIALRCERIGMTSMQFQGQIRRDDATLISARLTYVFADPTTQRPCAVPQPLRELMLSYEAGEAPADVLCGSWDTLGAEAAALRRAVFITEQGIDAPLDTDEQDAAAVHAVVRNRLGQAIATARLLSSDLGTGSLQRVAVRREVRGTQWGRLAVQALIDLATEQGVRQLRVCAQASAIPFWLRLGFVPEGALFQEAGRPHQHLCMQLVDQA